mmetsp:Transcript_28820/g.67598  ORF Transcript_28820/g.67598 Transcript_28820/m.67598 type:complete len:236 (-) Transcript_28820:959-1666(-)
MRASPSSAFQLALRSTRRTRIRSTGTRALTERLAMSTAECRHSGSEYARSMHERCGRWRWLRCSTAGAANAPSLLEEAQPSRTCRWARGRRFAITGTQHAGLQRGLLWLRRRMAESAQRCYRGRGRWKTRRASLSRRCGRPSVRWRERRAAPHSEVTHAGGRVVVQLGVRLGPLGSHGRGFESSWLAPVARHARNRRWFVQTRRRAHRRAGPSMRINQAAPRSVKRGARRASLRL